MAKKLEWMFSLIDKMSGPSKKIEKAVGGVDKQLQKANGPSEKLQKSIAKTDAVSAPAIGRLGAVAGALGGVATAAIAAAGAIGAIGIGVVGAASIMAIKASSARKDMLIGFEAVTGSGSAAVKALDEAGGLAKKIGISTSVVQKAYLDMLRLGVQRKHAPVIAQGLADLAATMGDEREAVFSQLSGVISQMSSTGKFDAGALKAVKTTLRTEDLEATLAKRLGVVPERVRKMLQEGKVSADEGIAALMETIQSKVNRGGALGSTAAKANSGIMSQFRIMRESFGDLFELVDISPLERAMAKVNALFTSERGAQIVEKINLVLGKLFKLVEDAAPTAISWIEKGIDTVVWLTDKAQVAYRYVEKLFKSDSFAKFTKGLKVLGIVAVVTTGLLIAPFVILGGLFFAAAYAVTTAIGYIFDFIYAIPSKLIEWGSRIGEWFAGLKERFVNIGSDIVNGLWAGIQGGWGWLKGKFKGLIDDLPYVVKKALGIASPSKVFRDLGNWTAIGFQDGIEAEMPQVSSTVQAMVAPPSFTAASMAGASRSGPNSINVVNNYQIDGAQDPQAIAAQIQEITLTSLASALEQLGIQSGAPVTV